MLAPLNANLPLAHRCVLTVGTETTLHHLASCPGRCELWLQPIGLELLSRLKWGKVDNTSQLLKVLLVMVSKDFGGVRGTKYEQYGIWVILSWQGIPDSYREDEEEGGEEEEYKVCLFIAALVVLTSPQG